MIPFPNALLIGFAAYWIVAALRPVEDTTAYPMLFGLLAWASVTAGLTA